MTRKSFMLLVAALIALITTALVSCVSTYQSPYKGSYTPDTPYSDPPPPKPSSSLPKIRFKGPAGNVLPGTPVKLSWKTENSDSVSISGVGEVGRNGSTEVTPENSTRYVLTARNASGETNAAVDIIVRAPAVLPPRHTEVPKIKYFKVYPPDVPAGGQCELSWQTEHADSVSISGLGQVNKSGKKTVTPAGTSHYVLTATNAKGEVTKEVNLSHNVPLMGKLPGNPPPQVDGNRIPKKVPPLMEPIREKGPRIADKKAPGEAAVNVAGLKHTPPKLLFPLPGTMVKQQNVELKWEAVPNAVTYTVEIMRDGKMDVIKSVKSTTYQLDLRGAKRCNWRVTSVGRAKGENKVSDWAEFKVQ